MSDKQTDEQLVESAISTIRRDYYASIKGIADDLRGEIKRGEIDDTDAAEQWLHETVDGCYWVIYNHATRKVLLVSDNDDAYEDAGVEIDYSQGLNHALTQIAYWAVSADIREELGDLDELFESNEESDED